MKSMTVMTKSEATLMVDVQIAVSEAEISESEEPPNAQALSDWANAAYQSVSSTPTEVTIRLVDVAEIVALNRDYRNKDQATNVLSFPVEIDPDIDLALLGDMVICHSIIVQEAIQQGKQVPEHYAHMVTHGLLHLCGYDHLDDTTAEQMESLEINILADQGIANPYL